jgi:hypothetical protein
MPMAAVPVPKVVVASVPVSTLLRHNAALAGNALGRQRIPPVRGEPRTRRGVGPWVKSGRPIDGLTRTSDGVSPVAIRRLRGVMRG